MPPVFDGEDVLVDGAAINNLPVDIMQRHAPGYVIGCDAGADAASPPNSRRARVRRCGDIFARGRGGRRRINIFQILMHAGMVNSVSSAAAQRAFADAMLKPPLANIDLLNWQAFDRAIEAGYGYARQALEDLPGVPRLAAAPAAAGRPAESSLAAELERRISLKAARAG